MAVTLQGSTLNNIHIGNSGGGGGASGGGASVGTFASRPAAGTAGRIYIATDSPITQWVDDGSAWRPLIQGQALGTQVPAASAFTAFNANGCTFADKKGTIELVMPSGTTNDTLHGGAISLSSATAYVEGVIFDRRPQQHIMWNIGLRESSTGKVFTCDLFVVPTALTSAVVGASRWSNDARVAYSSELATTPNAPVFTRVRRSGTNVIASWSRDGLDWMDFWTVATSTAFTSAPDQVIFGCSGYNSSGTFNLVHFKYGSL